MLHIYCFARLPGQADASFACKNDDRGPPFFKQILPAFSAGNGGGSR
jgi:hypothetical protein